MKHLWPRWVYAAMLSAHVFMVACSIDRDITRPVELRDLTTDEIRIKINSPDFKDKLEADRQIDKLEVEERRRILLKLSTDPDAPVRLIAAKHLKKIDHPEAHAALRRMAQEDPDETVREFAGER